MNEQKMREEFEADAKPYGFDITRYDCVASEPWSEYANTETGHRWGGWLAACESKQKVPAITRYEELGGADEPSPIERLRFFCSLAMDGQDWLNVEPFFYAAQREIDDLRGEQHQEKPPVEPEEVYSPHVKVIV